MAVKNGNRKKKGMRTSAVSGSSPPASNIVMPLPMAPLKVS